MIDRAPKVDPLFGMTTEQLDRYAEWCGASAEKTPSGSRMKPFLRAAAKIARGAQTGDFYREVDWV